MSRTPIEHISHEQDYLGLVADADGRYVVPESELLLNGTFHRAGHDLIISNDGFVDLRISGYFLNAPPADLHSPEGAVIRGDLVELMAGPIAPGQYAQADGGVGANPIGQVETLEGGASVQRVDGTVEDLQVGMKIFQRDVLQTEEGGSLSVTFVDGTIFTLASASRMVVDELIFDPDASDNSGGFSLIQGSFVFIAGQVAKTGGMEVSTPSSTMGIRGTTVLVDVKSQPDGVVITEIALTQDPTGEKGSFVVRDNAGNVIANVDQTDTKLIVTSGGEYREVLRDANDLFEDTILINDAFAAFRIATIRFEADGVFVTLSDVSPIQQQNSTSEGDAIDLDVDSIDEPDGIDQIENIDEAPDTNEQLPFDEGFIPFQENNIVPVVVVEVVGLEDATAEEPITGLAAFNGPKSENIVFQLADAPSNGDLTFNPDGTFSFVPDPDYNGTDSFTYKVFRGAQEVAEGTVFVKVLPVNDAPTSTDTALTVTEDGIVSGSVDASDIDGDRLTFTITVLPANGDVLLLPNGDFTYAPDLNFEGTDSFQVQATDPDGESTLATVSVTVEGENDAPIITTEVGENLGAVEEGAENNVVTGQLQAIDPDVADSVTWSGTSQAKYGSFSLEADGSWSYSLDNAKADVLAKGETVVEVFSAVVEDNNGASTPQTIEVTVTGTNDAPLVNALTFFETVQEVAFSGNLTALDLDGDAADLSFALSDTNISDGTVVVAADGSFSYTPAADFSGFDTFEYTVTDKDGGVTTGVAKIAVQSDPDSTENQVVSISFNEEAQPDIAANTIEVTVQTTEVTPVNLAIALDRSGSIGAVQWAQIVSAVQSAVTELALIYDGSDTSVDVQVITYGTDVKTTDIYDLQDPQLLTRIGNLVDDYDGGVTAWELALQATADFFFNEPANEPNFLLFVSDGEPTTGAWVVPYSELTDPTDEYDVTISAFGFGQLYNEAGLLELDPNAVFLDDPSQLADAFTATPIFNPELISFEVTLETETQEQIVIANENSEGFVIKGTDYELPLASIENIEALLGESNVIGITALFDVDGNPSDAEIKLFSTEVIGKSDSAQTLNGFEKPDLLFGSDMSDTISGGGGDDIIFGFDGDDTLSGGTGADIVRAGGGNDVIVVSEPADTGDQIDGGTGRDVLKIEVLGEINTLLATLDIEGIEAIDLDNGQSNTLTLSFDEIIELSDTSDTDLESLLDQALPNARTIYGDTSDDTVKDQLILDGEGTYTVNKTQTVTDDAGNSFDIYTFNLPDGNALATLGIDTDIEVTTENVVA